MTIRSLVFSSLVLCSAPLMSDISDDTYEVLDTKTVSSVTVLPQNLPKDKQAFDQKIVLNKLKTQQGELFSQTEFDQDLKNLSDDYDDVEPIIDTKDGKVSIVLKVWIRPTISEINWSGNQKYKVKTLRKELGLKAGQPLSKEALYKGINNLREYYAKKGYFEADIEPFTEYDKENNLVTLNISINEGRTGKIQAIDIEGFSKEEERMLRQMIYTKKYNLFISWLSGSGIYNEEAMEQDQQNIINFLQNRGYADANVKISIIDASSPGKVIIKIVADKGQVYKLGKISFDGNTVFPDNTVDKYFLARPGNIYSPENLRNTAQNLSDLYGSDGYIDANVQFETVPRENENIYDVHYTITEGKQYRVGLIHVLGNISTQDKIILRETALVPGELFNILKLKATQQRLESMGFFKNVNVYAVKSSDQDEEESSYRDVHIEVKEGMTGNAGLFFGFSTSEDLFGGLDIGETNFNIAGIPRIFKDGLSAVRGAGQYAQFKANIGSRQRSYSLSWMDPYFYDSKWRFGFDLVKNTNDVTSKDYTNDIYGFTIYASYPITSSWTYGMKYRFRDEFTKPNKELDRIVPNPKDDPGYSRKDETPKERKERQERYELRNHGLISAAAASLTYDTTFSWGGKPRKGLRSSYEAEYVGLGGKFDFGKLSWTNLAYSSLWSKGIMKYRMDFKFIVPVFNSNAPYKIPVAERYFLGGETTVRGYSPYDIGPHYENGNNDPRGGISSSLFSVEYNQEIFKFLDAFVFADAGSVSLKRFKFTPYRLSYGGGIRLQVLGQVPIMIGYGNPVNPGNVSVQKFFFSMGGQF
jgi:outer membrane protein insertion porin family